jgi:capsular polysaccharide biosynthesis protein
LQALSLAHRGEAVHSIAHFQEAYRIARRGKVSLRTEVAAFWINHLSNHITPGQFRDLATMLLDWAESSACYWQVGAGDIVFCGDYPIREPRASRFFLSIGNLASRKSDTAVASYCDQLSRYAPMCSEFVSADVQPLDEYCSGQGIDRTVLRTQGAPTSARVPASICAGEFEDAKTIEMPPPAIEQVTLKDVSIRGSCLLFTDEQYSPLAPGLGATTLQPGTTPTLIDHEPYASVTLPLVAGHIHFNMGYASDGKATLVLPLTVPRREVNGLLLTNRAATNYFHWLLECLTKVQDIEGSQNLSELPLIVHANMPVQHYDALRTVFGNDKPIILYHPHLGLTVDSLTLLSAPVVCHDDPDRPPERMCEWRPESIRYLAEKVYDSLGIEAAGRPGQRKIFLSRRSFGRTVKNHKEVERDLKGLGFEIVYPETLGFRDQVELMSKAAVVGGYAGASLANIMFVQPGTKILSLTSEPNRRSIVFSSLAEAVGAPFVTVAGPVHETRLQKAGFTNRSIELQSSFHLPKDDILKALQHLEADD